MRSDRISQITILKGMQQYQLFGTITFLEEVV